MTDLFGVEHKDNKDQLLGKDLMMQELKQLQRLMSHALSDEDIAHRMAVSKSDVRKLRRLIGGANTRLRDLKISYHIRVLLGEKKIRTLGDLFSWHDEALLCIKGIGPKSLEQIKRAAIIYMEERENEK